LDSISGFCEVDSNVKVLDRIFFLPISNIVTLTYISVKSGSFNVVLNSTEPLSFARNPLGKDEYLMSVPLEE
jgi:hypothetical protein